MLLIVSFNLFSQANTGSINKSVSQSSNGWLKGTVLDAKTKEPLIGATVLIVGTYKGTITDENGAFRINDIKPGDYTIKMIYIGYAEKDYTGIRIHVGENTLNADMSEITSTIKTIEIVGEKELVNMEDAKSEVTVTDKEIKQMNVNEVQDVVAMQNGVSVNPNGLQIRGGRIYETQYMVDGISAKDPLAGNGFGVNVGSVSVSSLNVITGGMDAQYGDGTSGVVATKIKEGTDSLVAVGNYQRDNLGYNVHGPTSFNTDIGNLSVGGPVPGTKKKLKFFTAATGNISDSYFGYTTQLHSSLFKNSTEWCPRYVNAWTHTIKLSYDIKPGQKITLTNQHSLDINQNANTLQVVGNNQLLQPGFQWPFALDLANATTYTHQSNLTVVNYTDNISDRVQMQLSGGRLFSNLRADANGQPFRDASADKVYDPASIVTNPVTLYNPQDTAIYPYPGPGLYNNGGLSTIWHDHYVQEYTLKAIFNYFPKSKYHIFQFGIEHKEQEYQWVDITSPWVGAPVRVNDSTTTPSTSIGTSDDIWKVRPCNGGIFAQDEIRYKGIIAFVGLRYNYWALGKYEDEAVEASPLVLPIIKQQYMDQTTEIFGRRYKSRLLPRLRVSFPISDNHVLYFNYGHQIQMPYPRFLYAGLDPTYLNQSYLANLGNPNLNPEETVSYELGLKSQITRDLAFTVTAFYNDKYGYIVAEQANVKDQTGQYVNKTFYINQDYARIRGLEVGINQRIAKWLRMTFNIAYQVATGKSSSALASQLQIQQTGTTTPTQETYLAWDRPIDTKLSFTIMPDSSHSMGWLHLNKYRVFIFSTYKSGLRYTPSYLAGYAPDGRPLYDPETSPTAQYSKVGSSWFWTDVKITRDYKINKRIISFSLEIKNIFGDKNAQQINPVTGRAYQYGDPVLYNVSDPKYPDPQLNTTPPNNPARYMQPRQILYGISFQL